ncbi:MAG: hypothetical protein INR71_14295, partial [Terriglobus roseus]|nr:hypothetical protein [Terriglobus roseus]
NNLNPDWDEVVYVPVHSPREKLVIEVMDYQNIGRDRTLGFTEVPAGDYIKQDDTGEWQAFEHKDTIKRPLRMGSTAAPKGEIYYTCSFYPTIQVVDPDEEEAEKARESVDGPRVGLHSRTASTLSTAPSVKAPATPVQDRARSGTISSLRSTKNGSLDMRRALAANEGEQEETQELKPEVPKIKLTADDLLQYGKLHHAFMTRQWIW